MEVSSRQRGLDVEATIPSMSCSGRCGSELFRTAVAQVSIGVVACDTSAPRTETPAPLPAMERVLPARHSDINMCGHVQQAAHAPRFRLGVGPPFPSMTWSAASANTDASGVESTEPEPALKGRVYLGGSQQHGATAVLLELRQ